MKFLEQPSRFLFFTGKGGVGKTSIACATAVHLARAGRRVLLVSTDPASNVGQVFGIGIGNRITAIGAVPRLAALEINPQAATQRYREQVMRTKGARCWNKTCVRPAPKKSPCSRPLRASSAKRASSSS